MCKTAKSLLNVPRHLTNTQWQNDRSCVVYRFNTLRACVRKCPFKEREVMCSDWMDNGAVCCCCALFLTSFLCICNLFLTMSSFQSTPSLTRPINNQTARCVSVCVQPTCCSWAMLPGGRGCSGSFLPPCLQYASSIGNNQLFVWILLAWTPPVLDVSPPST